MTRYIYTSKQNNIELTEPTIFTDIEELKQHALEGQAYGYQFISLFSTSDDAEQMQDEVEGYLATHEFDTGYEPEQRSAGGYQS